MIRAMMKVRLNGRAMVKSASNFAGKLKSCLAVVYAMKTRQPQRNHVQNKWLQAQTPHHRTSVVLFINNIILVPCIQTSAIEWHKRVRQPTEVKLLTMQQKISRQWMMWCMSISEKSGVLSATNRSSNVF